MMKKEKTEAFSDYIKRFPPDVFREMLAAADGTDVEKALGGERLDIRDFAALLSPSASEYLEPMARKAVKITRMRFGNMIVLYTPLYLSNECVGTCRYCGFRHDVEIPRKTLNFDEAAAELDSLKRHGFDHVLLLTGDHRRAAPPEYIEKMVRSAAERFHSVSLEVYALTEAEYARMIAAGCDGVTLYQETYDEKVYHEMHPAGPKSNYPRRLDTPSYASAAGMRSIGLGFLLGLTDWRTEAMYLGLHSRYLMRRWWRMRIAISFPRLCPSSGGFQPTHPVSDRELVQLMLAVRLFLPDAETVISTREPAALRDRLVSLGITRMSAGSRTEPGGYTHPKESGEQFKISDTRTPEEIAALIEAHGFEAVWKDFDRAFTHSADD